MWVNKLIVFLLVAVFLITSVQNSAFAREIVVDANNSSADFRSIQEAVNNSSSGDVILIYPGFYNESVDIGVQNISILSESENPEDTTVRAFKLGENNITVSGFSVQESLTLQGYILPIGYNSHYPIENCTIKSNILESDIYADECYNSTIEKNVIVNGGIGVSSFDYHPGSSFTVSDNLIVEGNINVHQGPNDCILLNNTLLNGSIRLTECADQKVLGNYISNSPDSGINLWESSGSEIEDNTIVNCSKGIVMEYRSQQNTINNNTLIGTDRGISVEGISGGDLISNNKISSSNIGILLSGSSLFGDPAGENSLLNNTISNNNIGILFEGYSSDNIVTNNKVELNRQCGIYINNLGCGAQYGATNQFYNNMFNNTVNFFNDTSNYKNDYTSIYTGNSYTAEPIDNVTGVIPISLNTTKTSGTNIVGGPYLGGNYWAKPDGTGFSQICADSDGNGIGDLPYSITDNDTDYFPLVSASRSQESIIPIANFTTNITHTLVPLAVQFTDLSQNAVAWSWDFDSNGIPDSINQNPIHTYTALGTYIINLTVSNGKEISSKSLKMNVQEAKVPPVADFSTNVTGGRVSLSVKFTDFSKNATAVIWDFNNDGIPDSTERNPVYVYTYPGNYTVNLTVNNTKGMDSKSSTVTVSPAQRLKGKLVLTEYQITTSKSDETQPAIYEDRIVWQSNNHNDNYTLHLYNISTSSETQIASSNISEFCPVIYNDRVVLREYGKIYLLNLSTSTKTLVSNQLGIYLAIYGDKIVWQGECNGICVYMYDISSSKQIRLTDNRSISYLPAIHENRIVWESRLNINESSKIFMYDLSTERVTQVITDKSNQERPAVYGDRIVWEDYRNGNLNIYMYDLSTAKEIQITTSGSSHDPAIYGDRIVWQDDRNDKEYIENSDIYMYDLSTKKETQITTSGLASSPVIYGDKIVWEDRRNGKADIYMCIISEQGKGSPDAGFSASPVS
ncbi:cell surface protein [Methanosarcina barkeri 3]|uniref:Cell surface protein n=1 Tax=Methanosarcina barkeri 3 TaxID=1434107 RepID=A0A0E3SJW4_METBA|nr:NosD domain-containing protein [Methanosarcina barkeri]AKB81092.1 cell surface protein [Methanosarcina barkeri 3]